MKFEDLKVGMEVKFREDLKDDTKYNGIYYGNDMNYLTKSTQIVKEIKNGNPYSYIKVDMKPGAWEFIWTSDMIDWEATEKLNSITKETVSSLVSKVIVNAPAVIVIFNDGTKQVAKCDENDVFNVEKGILVCLSKKLLGNYDKLNKVLKMGIVKDVINPKARVIRNLMTHSSFKLFLTSNNIDISNWEEGCVPTNGEVGEVIFKRFNKLYDKNICVFKDSKGKVFVIGEDGIEYL